MFYKDDKILNIPANKRYGIIRKNKTNTFILFFNSKHRAVEKFTSLFKKESIVL